MLKLRIIAPFCILCALTVAVAAWTLTSFNPLGKSHIAESAVAQASPTQIPANVNVVIVPPEVKEKDAQDEDRINPTLDPKSKYKVYVPVSLDDAFAELKKMLSPKVLKEMKDGTEKDMVRYHMGLGMWMRNNWGLWGGSRLAKYFNNLGVHHPDDMSGIILRTFWRHLNSQPLELERHIAYSQAYWRAVEEPKKKSCPIDGSVLELLRSLIDEDEQGMPRVIYAAWCKRDKHVWAFEHGKGWYEPDAELRKRIGVD